jgi:hypothetical protein
MALLNRCAVSVRPQGPMLDWIRPFAQASERDTLLQESSVYLIPCFEDQTQAWQGLQQISERIFQSELELWCRDPELWPQERSHQLFLEWFSVSFHPLVDDLASDPLDRSAIDPSFARLVRQTLDDRPLEPRSAERQNG